jgi:hypothetical protein
MSNKDIRVHKKKKSKTKDNTIWVGHHYTAANTYNVNKTSTNN